MKIRCYQQKKKTIIFKNVLYICNGKHKTKIQSKDLKHYPNRKGKSKTATICGQYTFIYWQPKDSKEMVTHSSIPAWKTPWTEEPGGLQSMGSTRVRHNLATKPPLKLNPNTIRNNKQIKSS